MNRPMGVIYGMPADEYHAIDAMSSTALRLLARSPWHLKNRVKVTPTRPMLNGTLAHCAILEADAMASRYVVVPEKAPRRPTAAQWAAKNPSDDSMRAMDWWTTFKDAVGQREIVAHEDYEITKMQLEAVKADPEIAALLATGNSEVSLFWVDRETGVYCKARPDHIHQLPDGRFVGLDLKATADDTPAGFSRSMASMGYHRQEAHYTAGIEAVLGEVSYWVFAVVSSAPPVLATPYRTDIETKSQARDEVSELLHLYAECRRRDYWPSYTADQRVIGLPAWARRSNEVEVSFVQS